jgi:hypothetical protein
MSHENCIKRIQELEKQIEELTWKLYRAQWQEIYDFFNENGIRLTAEKFEMTIRHVMDFIVECDNNTDGLQSAKDYHEFHKDYNGIENEDDSVSV